MYIFSSGSTDMLMRAYDAAYGILNSDYTHLSQTFEPSREVPFKHFYIMQFDVGNYIVYENDDVNIIVEDGETYQTLAVCKSVKEFVQFVDGINNSSSQMNDRNYSVNAGRRISRRR